MKPGDRNVTLRMFVDHSVIEAYAQGGRAVVTQWGYLEGYPTDDAPGVAVGTTTRGGGGGGGPKGSAAGIIVLALDAGKMDTIWVDKV
eukprot:SAG22_NODE_8812_length_628_cov_1.194707_1_plen_88_part_00